MLMNFVCHMFKLINVKINFVKQMGHSQMLILTHGLNIF